MDRDSTSLPLHKVRAAHLPSVDAWRPVGGNLLIDYCRINIDLGRDTGADRVRVPGMVVAIDEGSKVVLGFGLWFERVAEGYSGLVGDVARRLPTLADSGRIAPAFDTIRWVVPPELQSRADGVGSEIPASRRPRIALVPHGERRSGARLVSLVGNHIGDIMLLVRPSGGGGSGPSRAHARVMHSAPDMEAAAYIVSAAVDAWNAARIAAAAQTTGGGVATARRNASALEADFAKLFVSVLS